MRTRTPLLAVAALAACALAACSAPAPTDYDVVFPDSDDAASATADDAWLIEFDHVGPVGIGAPFSEVAEQFPGLQIEDMEGYCGSGYWPDAEPPLDGLGLLAESQGTQGPVDRVFVGIGTSAPDEPRTAEGIGIGATRAEVQAAYPAIAESPHTYVENGSYLDLENGSGLAMRFLTDENGVVDGIIVGRIPQVYYVEGCL